ncbi:acyl-CoA dehydrogenase [Vibrio alfacsensis]|uniref:Acyl-CoA dehydrogenase n=1 Tax=Vibrio alfacsensis TaxID=1074311 RepID=A0ABN5PC52_9VIBR|nr:acyl-CoA dehydrogenase family protein [Vibrio alfacsensis]AXY00904.1 acyl-CoA dehydrogenase [Vibrio alfacsensis]
MNFSYTDEQIMIEQSASDFFSEVSPIEAAREIMVTEQGYDVKVWQKICDEMFFHGILIPEENGGLGLGYVELCIVLEQIGAKLACLPFHASACMATSALLVAGSEYQKQYYFEHLLRGEVATLAYTGIHTGTKTGWGCDAVDVTYQKQGQQYRLNGTYRYVSFGHNAQWLILAARKKGTRGKEGISLFVTKADTPGISRNLLPTMDQTQKQAQIELDNVLLDASCVMPNEGHCGEALHTVIAVGQIGLAAEQLGGAQAVLEQTVQYTQQRTQFNRPIASFQAVKHQAADMMLKAEAGCSSVYYAACTADATPLARPTSTEITLNGRQPLSERLNELCQAAYIAKSYCSDAYFFNAATAIQLHGGVGFTWEFDVHLYFKRAQASGVMLGNSAYHHELIAEHLLPLATKSKNQSSGA